MAVKAKTTLKADLQVDFADNNVGAISEAILRGQQNDIIDSLESVLEKGQPDGYAPLNSSAKIELQYLPDSVKTGSEYKGVWDASTNTPTLANGTGNNGDYYRVQVAGTVDLGSGPVTYEVGDLVVYDGSLATWDRVGRDDAVTSVNGKLGDVVLNADDIDPTPTRIWFTSIEQAKLAGIEDGATADMTSPEIKAAYESNPNTNAFTDALKTKLEGIEAGATADQNAAEVPYDNSSSGMLATNMQDAADELRVLISSSSGGDASNISYDNTSSGLSATDVQAALDELASNINNIQIDGGTF